MGGKTMPRPVQSTGYQVEILDGEAILFHPASMKVLHSNQSGVLIWQLCDGQRDVGEIVRILASAYPEAAGDIERDVREILAALAEQGAIEWR
jgi:coenzyme PQQ biosynthesis protein PqqD